MPLLLKLLALKAQNGLAATPAQKFPPFIVHRHLSPLPYAQRVEISLGPPPGLKTAGAGSKGGVVEIENGPVVDLDGMTVAPDGDTDFMALIVYGKSRRHAGVLEGILLNTAGNPADEEFIAPAGMVLKTITRNVRATVGTVIDAVAVTL